MINIDFSNADFVQDDTSLFQWDYGQKLCIIGLNVTNDIQVHFARSGQMAEIRIGAYANGVIVVAIPDAILQKPGKINAYIYLTDATSGETVKIATLNVREREQPTDYTSPEYYDVVKDLSDKLNQIITTGIAQYAPDPAVVHALVVSELNARLGTMASKNEVAKTDLASALQTEFNGKFDTSKIVNSGSTTEAGFALDARYGKTLKDMVDTTNNNLANKFKIVTLANPQVDVNTLGVVNSITFYTLTGSPIDGVTSTQGLLMAYRTTSLLYGCDFYMNQNGMYFRTLAVGTWSAWTPK